VSITHILLIAVVALVLFGPSKLPELGRALGRTMREFKKGAQDLMDDEPAAAPTEERKDVTPHPGPDPVSGLAIPPSVPAAPQAAPASSASVESASTASAAPSGKADDPRRLPD
jgi:sec-independent protein translocase protein TatA